MAAFGKQFRYHPPSFPFLIVIAREYSITSYMSETQHSRDELLRRATFRCSSTSPTFTASGASQTFAVLSNFSFLQHFTFIYYVLSFSFPYNHLELFTVSSSRVCTAELGWTSASSFPIEPVWWEESNMSSALPSMKARGKRRTEVERMRTAVSLPSSCCCAWPRDVHLDNEKMQKVSSSLTAHRARLTVEHVHSYAGHNRVGRRATVLAGVGLVGVLNQQMRCCDVSFAGIDRDAAPQRVIIYHLNRKAKS